MYDPGPGVSAERNPLLEEDPILEYVKKSSIKTNNQIKNRIKPILDRILADILGEIVSTRSRYELTVGIFYWNLRSEGEMFALRFLVW